MNEAIQAFNNNLATVDKQICHVLATTIDAELTEAESKIWHSHPVWFLDGNPIVGYSKQKAGMRLMFWSGAGFEEEGLNVIGKKFKDASIFLHDSRRDRHDIAQPLAEKVKGDPVGLQEHC